ncbi:hypothetical protein [Owenweeksia hongkongensis]|uniref:Uncharacterized protein n=1 Tax=Owenweeksia hongkongensis (strain DSM 17368 / CIP 108786 / JCM 12287 / NRRL B-23963 / UST20020801) TaxID=926562 RepID=G8QZT6_OWEHD|nr:hypothetical protein [Owenweeksia hongkongensis]AEV31530.1 hypothetical protein Oweho_0514 [Owenweeksia hongkongensis DSM 17368]
MLQRLFTVILLLIAFSAMAEPASYIFCIEAEGFESFKAVVTFRAVDFGEGTARQMVMNKVRPALGDTTKIDIILTGTCPCGTDCQTLKVVPKNWSGNLSENYDKGGAKTLPSSCAAVIDKLAYEAESLFSDPGGFLKRNLFGQK